MSLGKVLRVFHKQGNPYSVLLESRKLEDGILLECGAVVSLSAAEKEEIKGDYSKAIDAYGCLGAVKFNESGAAPVLHLVLITACMPVGKVLNSEVFRITGASFFSLQNGSTDQDGRCSDLKKLLSSGKFYFSWSSNLKSSQEMLDLTVSLQNQGQKDEEERFFWNRLMHLHFKHFGADCDSWLVRIMCGGIDIRTVYVGAQQAKAMVISRLSRERAGTRFNIRGANDEGNVANFVESEQVIVIGNNISSFMQIRGSIPFFWEQPGLNVGSHKVQFSRGFEASVPTYERHFMKVLEYYNQCLIVNLLGSKEGETMLSTRFQEHHENSDYKDQVPMFCFDYHVECRGGKWDNLSRLKAKIWGKLEDYGCYTYKEEENVRQPQTGVARINCLDCLDRTNSTKTYFGLQMLPKQLEKLGFGGNKQLEDRFLQAFKAAWPVTGDLISRMYAGTGALEGKKNLKDGARSVTRAIQNNFLDQNKQNAIDLMILGTSSVNVELASRASNLLSGDCLQAPSGVLKGMCENYSEYTSIMQTRVAIGTWNVNGGKHFRSIAYKDQTLDDWLLNFGKSCLSEPDKYVALYDFPGGEEDDLAFVSGDVIVVTEILPDGEWMRGKCNGMSGIFPTAYVTKLLPRYVAMFDFEAQQEGDLGFQTGDIIQVTNMVGDWWKGKLERQEYNPDEPEGNFPASYVEMCKESPQKAAMTPGFNEEDETSLVDWNKAIDIYVIGFQEMVELSAGNIVNTSHTNQLAWGVELEKTLSSKYKYILLASEQLVGVCLYVFVRPQHAPHIREVEIETVKTGMGGATGNKGGIGIRMQFYNSSVCFVCSHLAAGQTQIQDRNNDFAEISKRMTFNGGKSIYCHDYVFWCGDLNYRIDMPIDTVKCLVQEKDWGKLRENDQLYQEKKGGRTFKYFKEGETNFAPTYKYDLFSDEYDTSEKSRTPAWTDRVLWFRRKWFAEKQEEGSLVSVNEDPDWNSGSLLYYDRAELKTSDHRPVIAVLDIDVLQSAEEHLDATFHEIVAAQGPPDASILVSLSQEEGIENEPMSEDLHTAILTLLGSVGVVIVTRQFKGKMLVIFKEGTSAVEALSLNGTSVQGTPIFISSKTGGWEEEVEHELRHRAHSTSINESFTEKYAKQEPVHYDYPPDEEYQDHGAFQSDNYNDATYESEQYQSSSYDTANTEEPLHDVNDPGWACENNYYTAESYDPPVAQPQKQTKKAPAPPRPSSAPTKKRAPPRPDTLPTMPIGPPPLPSTSPAFNPGPPGSKPAPPSRSPAVSPPSGILIPESVPFPTKPKPTPRASLPKRRAPAPPPGKPPAPRKLSGPPPPPLPLTPPKGPSKASNRVHHNAAFIPENHSAPSLLDFDPFGPISNLPSVTNRPSSAGTPVMEPLQPVTINPTPAFKPPIAPRRSSSVVTQASTLPPNLPPPVLNRTLSDKTMWPPSIPSKPVSVNPPPHFGSVRPNYKSMTASMPQNSAPSGFMGSQVLQPQMAAPFKPTISNGSTASASLNDPFGLNSNQSVFQSSQTNPKHDPWGEIRGLDSNGNISNSFSTDFSKMSFR